MVSRIRIARALAAALTFVTATFHLLWGLPRALIYLQGLSALLDAGLPPDPRPFFFVAFAAVLLAGPLLVTRGYVSIRRAYQWGLVLMVASFLAWVGWHKTGHGAFLVDAPRPAPTGHSHGGVLVTIYDHYVTTPTEGLIKSVELLAGATLGWLLWRDPAASDDNGANVDGTHSTRATTGND